MPHIADGRCRCGSIHMRVTLAPLISMACHCVGCQQMTGSAFSVSALVLSSNFEVMSGDPVIGGLRGATRHYFCLSCMSWLFTRPEGMDEVVNLRSTLFGALADRPPFIETWTSGRREWAVTGAVHSFAELPDPSTFPELMQAFAEQDRQARR